MSPTLRNCNAAVSFESDCRIDNAGSQSQTESECDENESCRRAEASLLMSTAAVPGMENAIPVQYEVLLVQAELLRTFAQR